MANEEPHVCESCGLADWSERQDKHLTPQDCIRALRKAMLRQRTSAEQLGMDLSIHFLRALEELSLDPEVGVSYHVFDPESGKRLQVPGQQVSGVFAALLKKYREVADFSPHEREKEVTAYWASVAGRLAGLLMRVSEKYELDDVDKTEAKELIQKIEQTRFVAGQPDLADS